MKCQSRFLNNAYSILSMIGLLIFAVIRKRSMKQCVGILFFFCIWLSATFDALSMHVNVNSTLLGGIYIGEIEISKALRSVNV